MHFQCRKLVARASSAHVDVVKANTKEDKLACLEVWKKTYNEMMKYLKEQDGDNVLPTLNETRQSEKTNKEIFMEIGVYLYKLSHPVIGRKNPYGLEMGSPNV